jgi:hypothetical protein
LSAVRAATIGRQAGVVSMIASSAPGGAPDVSPHQLQNEMRRGAEAGQAQRLAISQAAQPQGAIADRAGAKQRRRGDIAVRLRIMAFMFLCPARLYALRPLVV